MASSASAIPSDRLFEHARLPKPDEDIRLLVLRSRGRTNDQIEMLDGVGSGQYEGDGEYESKQPVPKYPYEALSYTWEVDWRAEGGIKKAEVRGHELVSFHLTIDGRMLAIGTNLTRAIARLRKDPCSEGCLTDCNCCSRRLWIDAVCINQNDLEERALQVSFMSRIFASAERCVVWFGEDSEGGNGEASFAFMRQLVESYALKPRQNQRGYLEELKQEARVKGIIHTPSKPLDPLKLFFKRRYFSRLWIVQEVVSAERLILLLCGSHSLDWHTFEGAMIAYHHTCDELPAVMHVDTRLRCGKTFRSERFIKSLEFSYDMQCLDDRDRIGALFSLHDAPLHIDYTASVEENYIKLAALLAEDEDIIDLIFLAARRMAHRDQHMVARLDVPSWVPDLRYFGPGYKSYDSVGPAYQAHLTKGFAYGLTFDPNARGLVSGRSLLLTAIYMGSLDLSASGYCHAKDVHIFKFKSAYGNELSLLAFEKVSHTDTDDEQTLRRFTLIGQHIPTDHDEYRPSPRNGREERLEVV
jgi:hypothetical protein